MAAICVVALAATAPAGAGAVESPDVNGDGDGISAGGRVTIPRPPRPGGGGGDTGNGGNGDRPKPLGYIATVEVRVDSATGGRCLHVGNRPGDPSSAEAMAAEARIFDLSTSYRPCPDSPPRAVVPPSPAAMAEMLWSDRMQLPSPTPRIAPGWAVAGKRAHLEIGGPARTDGTFDALGSTIAITAIASSYDVDWGDGTVSLGLAGQGGPWPHGDIRHVYTRAGTYDVAVTQRWRGAWTMGPLSGTVRGVLATSGRIDDIEVREVQAVRDR